MARSLLILGVAALAFLISCSGPQSAGTSGSGATAPAASSPAQPGSAGANRNASLQLSGTVSGGLSVQGLSCQPAGSANLLASISGTNGSAQYTIDVGAPSAGTYQLSTQAPATVGLTETAPSFRRWATGSQQPSGSGSLSIEKRRGQVNAEVAGIQGAPGSVRIEGDWTCP